MSKEYTTIRLEQSAKDTAQEAKRDGETWSDYILRCTDESGDVKRFVNSENISVTLDATEREKIAQEVLEGLQR